MVEINHPPYSPDCISQLFAVLECEDNRARERFQDIEDIKITAEPNAISVAVFGNFCATFRET
jgi:hypothetical protein